MALDLSFARLAEIAQRGGGGRPIEIPLDDIVEDPDQPRRLFDERELADLAASIRAHGVIQAISVRPKNAQGKHVIIVGARRFRASRLAGRDHIRAVIEDGPAPEPYVQIIENIQRDDLKPIEIAAFVAGRLRAGDKASDIAERLGKPRDWVSRYAAVAKMPAFLQDKLQTSPIRAVYDLYQAWRDQPEAVERLVAAHETFTDAQARRLVQALRHAPEPADGPAGEGSLAPSSGALYRAVPDNPPQAAALTPDARPAAPRPRPSGKADPEHPSSERDLAREVRHLEGDLRCLGTPQVTRLLAHYDGLIETFTRDLASPREALLSRRAALLLIQAAAAD